VDGCKCGLWSYVYATMSSGTNIENNGKNLVQTMVILISITRTFPIIKMAAHIKVRVFGFPHVSTCFYYVTSCTVHGVMP
jgi:hypothetical protein